MKTKSKIKFFHSILRIIMEKNIPAFLLIIKMLKREKKIDFQFPFNKSNLLCILDSL